MRREIPGKLYLKTDTNAKRTLVVASTPESTHLPYLENTSHTRNDCASGGDRDKHAKFESRRKRQET
jgi:hypothetical protein